MAQFLDFLFVTCFTLFKDTHREKAPSNKSPAFMKIMNMDIWVH